MKPMRLYLIPLLAALCLPTSALHSTAEAAVRHRFLCSDHSGGKVCIVDERGQIEWEFKAGGPQDCWMLPNGNVLFSHLGGAKEVTMNKEVVWEYRAPNGTEVHAAQPLPDGSVLIGECGTKRLLEVDRTGTIVREVPVNVREGIRTHVQFRGARKLPSGNYVVAFVSERRFAEIDPAGNVVREFQVPGNPVEAVPLRSGNWLVTCGYSRHIQEMNPEGQVVWSANQTTLPDSPLYSITGAQRLRNGNTVIANWLGGHAKEGSVHLYELTPDKQLVWSFADLALFKGISQFQILDPAEGKLPWEVER